MSSLKTLAILLVFLAGCSQPKTEETTHAKPSVSNAVAVVHPVGDSGVMGTVYFKATEEGVAVKATLNGLVAGNHGFHIHQYGDCTAPDGTSAGGHFNPGGNQHNSPDADDRHMGDMGNIMADSNGFASLEYVDSTIRMDQILGRGIIVHAGEDDLSSQPSGAAGPRVACGVIGVQK